MSTGFTTSCPVCHEIEAFNVATQQCERCNRITRPMPPVPPVRFNINIYVKVSIVIGLTFLITASFLLQGKLLDLIKSLTIPVVKEKVRPAPPPKPQPPKEVTIYVVSKLQDQQEQEESRITIGNVTKTLTIDRANGTTEGKVKFTLPVYTPLAYSIKTTTTLIYDPPGTVRLGKGEGTWSFGTDQEIFGLRGDWNGKAFDVQLQLLDKENY